MNRLFRFGYRIGSLVLTVPVLLMVFVASACGSGEPVVIERTVVVEVIREVEVTREVKVIEEVEVEKIVEVVVTATPTSAPAGTPQPVATTTPDVDDYFVVLHQGILDDGVGHIAYFNRFSRDNVLDGPIDYFHNEEFYIDYLSKEGVITSNQKADYFDGKPIQKIPLVDIAVATQSLFENDPYNAGKLGLLATEYLLQYAE